MPEIKGKRQLSKFEKKPKHIHAYRNFFYSIKYVL